MAKKIALKKSLTGIKIISVMTYIVSVLMIFFGAWFALNLIYGHEQLGVAGIGVILFLIGGLFAFRIAMLLRKRENYARKFAIVLYTVLTLIGLLAFNELFGGWLQAGMLF